MDRVATFQARTPATVPAPEVCKVRVASGAMRAAGARQANPAMAASVIVIPHGFRAVEFNAVNHGSKKQS